MNVLIGYARVSRRDQNPEAQVAELYRAGAERFYLDHGEPSRISNRPQWVACLARLEPGDTLLVRRLDRVPGSERMTIDTLFELNDRGVDIRSLTEPEIDTATPMGRALLGIVAVFAQLRVDTIRDTLRGWEVHRAPRPRAPRRQPQPPCPTTFSGTLSKWTSACMRGAPDLLPATKNCVSDE